MRKSISTIAVLTSVFVSCGPSPEQIALEEKRKLDSATFAGQQQLLKQQAEEQAKAEEEARQESLKQQLIDLKSQLAGEEVKLKDIEHFKFLRSIDEKVEQIAEQTKSIEEIKAQIAEIESQIK